MKAGAPSDQNKRPTSGVPLYVDRRSLKVADPANGGGQQSWTPANAITFKLLASLEPVRDLTVNLASLAKEADPAANKRVAKQLATPIHILVLAVRDMFNELIGNSAQYSLSEGVVKAIQARSDEYSSNVFMAKKSDLRAVRDKIDAHLDMKAVMNPSLYWGLVDLATFLGWIRICLEEVLNLLMLDVYAWSGPQADPNVWSLMTVDGTVVEFLMKDGQPQSILSVTLAESPKGAAFAEICGLIDIHNELAGKCSGVEKIVVVGLDDEGKPVARIDG